MNKAIMLYTFKRYIHWSKLLSLCSYLLMTCLLGIGLVAVDQEVTRELGRALLFGPFFPIVISYMVVCPHIANSQRAKDGEYLSLIFSRPISRCSYMLTKWLCGAIAVLIVQSVQILIVMGVALCMGRHSSILDLYCVIDVICNAFAFSAVVVFIASFPHRLGLFVMCILTYVCLILTLASGAITFITSMNVMAASKTLFAASQIFLSIFAVSIDSYHLVNSSQNPLASAAIYLSNVALYLTLATLIMNRREFFYAND